MFYCSHPLVSTDCTDAVRRQYLAESGGKDVLGNNETPSTVEDKKAAVIAMSPPVVATLSPPPASPTDVDEETSPGRIAVRMETVSLGRARLLRSNTLDGSKSRSSASSSALLCRGQSPSEQSDVQYGSIITVPTRRHPTLLLELPQPLGGPVQLHPRDSHAGLACMIDGSLALFWMHPMAFYETLHSSISDDNGKAKTDMNKNEFREQWVMNLLREEEKNRVGNLAFLVPPKESKVSADRSSGPDYFITCAAFGKNDVLWAVTK